MANPILTLVVGETVNVLARPRNFAGQLLTTPITWASSNTAVCTVTATLGAITAVGTGVCAVTASSGGN